MNETMAMKFIMHKYDSAFNSAGTAILTIIPTLGYTALFAYQFSAVQAKVDVVITIELLRNLLKLNGSDIENFGIGRCPELTRTSMS